MEQSTNQLAQGVGALAQNSGELTKEIRDNRPISANVLFNDFLANRVQTDFTATRKGLFGSTTKDGESKTVFTTDGKQVYALVDVEDTAVLVPGGRRRLEEDRGPLRPAARLPLERLADRVPRGGPAGGRRAGRRASRSPRSASRSTRSPPTRSSSPRPCS